MDSFVYACYVCRAAERRRANRKRLLLGLPFLPPPLSVRGSTAQTFVQDRDPGETRDAISIYIYKITSAASLACLTLLRLLGPPTSRPVTRSFVPTSLSRIPLSFSLSLSLLLPIAVYRSVIERFLPSRKVLFRLEISLSLCQRSMPWNTAVRKLENHNRELSRGKY